MTQPTNPAPLQGIRVADFGQVIAAPVTAQMLGWLGAEVILVETESRFTTRVWPPFADGKPGINQSGGFNLVNNNKLSCSLDLSNPDALEVAKGIIGVSDVLVENYATGALERLGLGYEVAKMLRPDIIYMSLGAFGRTGPFKDLTGFHSVINLFSGLAAVTGYPGTHPRIMGGLIPDAFAGCYAALAILEALYHRSRTGEGQYIEVSMTEALTGMIPEAVMEYSLTGMEQPRVGNRDGRKSPHNVFRCLGEDKWVAVSVENRWAVPGPGPSLRQSGMGQRPPLCHGRRAPGKPGRAGSPRAAVDVGAGGCGSGLQPSGGGRAGGARGRQRGGPRRPAPAGAGLRRSPGASCRREAARAVPPLDCRRH